MDIFRFIRSNAIKAYLKEINYSFSTPEAAYLVWQYPEISLKEKFKAWDEIIDNLPNCSMPERMNMKEIKSLHDFLKQYMCIQNKWIDEFNCSMHVFYSYQYRVREYSNGKWQYFTNEKYEHMYSSLEECKNYLMDEINDYSDADIIYDIYEITVRRHSFNNPNHTIAVHLNVKLEILDMEIKGDSLTDNEREVLSSFEGMWFNIPTPFKTGDVLCKGNFYSETEQAKKEEMNPFILCRINTWDAEKMKENLIFPESKIIQADKKIDFLLQDGDITDMGFSAYYMERDGINHHLYWNHGEYYLSLEYYEKDFVLR